MSTPMNATTEVGLRHQGKVVVERDGSAFLAMFPDGTVRGFGNRRAVERAAKEWFRDNLPQGVGGGVGVIEWPAE